MSWEWVAPVGSGVIGVAGLLFGWASSGRGQKLTAALAKEGNAHAQALARASNEHARQLERLRYDHGERERQQRRLEESYLEIATTVIRTAEPGLNVTARCSSERSPPAWPTAAATTGRSPGVRRPG